MKHAKPLPEFLQQRYLDWRDKRYPEKEELLRTLVSEGQNPSAMVISCCDSRVQSTDIFGVSQGEVFMHRNIAALVPPYLPDGNPHGTSAALEFAVTVLKVSHVIVMGHSQCGGVQGCIDMCSGKAPHLEEDTSFVGRWIEVLRPEYPKVSEIADPDEQSRAFEKVSVVASLENLMTFPFVVEAVEAGTLSIHGLWNNIAEGVVEVYDSEADTFISA